MPAGRAADGWLTPGRSLVLKLALSAAAVWVAAPMVSPSLRPADSGELQAVVRDLGIAHPPGYPLYTMVAHAFGRVAGHPAVTAALRGPSATRPDLAQAADGWTWSVNLLSLVLAVGTLGLMFEAGTTLVGSKVAGLFAVALLAAGPTFVAQSTVANIRMPTAFLAAAWLAATVPVLVGARPVTSRRAAGVGLLATLAVGHHVSLAFVVLPVALGVAVAAGRDGFAARRVMAGLGGAAMGLAPLAYLPIRDAGGALQAPGDLTHLHGFLYHVTAAGFRGDMLALTGGATLLDRSLVLAAILRIQFGLLALAVIGLGLAWLAARRRLVATVLAASAVLLTAAAVTYRAPQTMEYLLPAYVVLALIGSACAGWIGVSQGRPAEAGRLVVAAVLAVGLSARGADVPRAVKAADMAQTPSVSVLAPGCLTRGTLLAAWHFAPPLAYAARHWFPGSKVEVRYVYPEGAEPIGATWRRRLAAAAGPAVITNRTREIVTAGASLWPVWGSPYWSTEPLGCGRHDSARGEVLGDLVRVEAVAAPLTGRPPFRLTLRLRPVRPVSETLTVFAQLADPAGSVWAQVDHALPAERWNDPRGLEDALDLVPFRGALPEHLAVLFGVYRVTPDGTERLSGSGGDTLSAGELVTSGAAERSGAVPAGEVPFGDAMTLERADISRGASGLVVDLVWRAEAAYASDYSVSVQAEGTGWSVQDDGTPALGAIPTLKWLPGMRIPDRHRLNLSDPSLLDSGYSVRVAVYDAFSLEPLPVTDRERARAGEGQFVTIR